MVTATMKRPIRCFKKCRFFAVFLLYHFRTNWPWSFYGRLRSFDLVSFFRLEYKSLFFFLIRLKISLYSCQEKKILTEDWVRRVNRRWEIGPRSRRVRTTMPQRMTMGPEVQGRYKFSPWYADYDEDPESFCRSGTAAWAFKLFTIIYKKRFTSIFGLIKIKEKKKEKWYLRITNNRGRTWIKTRRTHGAITCVCGDRKWTLRTTTVTHML